MQLDLFYVQIVDGNFSYLIIVFVGCYGYIQIVLVLGCYEFDEGEINYVYLFGLLDEINYKGWIGCEYYLRVGIVVGLSWI